MPEPIVVIDVIVPPPPVIDVAAIGVQGPPGVPGEDGEPGPPGPQGEPGPPGEGAGPHQASHAAGGADQIVGPIALGVNPAQSGALRLANTGSIQARNAANTADHNIATTAGGDLYVGDASLNLYISGGAVANVSSASGNVSIGTGGGGNYQFSQYGIYPLTDNARDLGFAANRFGAAHFGQAVNIGQNPAQSGAVRLANASTIAARNQANTANLDAVTVWTDDKIYVGDALNDAGLVLRTHGATIQAMQHVTAPSLAVTLNPASVGAIRIGNGGADGIIKARNAANTADIGVLLAYSDNKVYVGDLLNEAGLVIRSAVAVEVQGPLQFPEQAAPAAPAANLARVWCEDNGAGKSRLMVQFATGAAIQLAIQP